MPDTLQTLAEAATRHAHVPYSQRPEGAAIHLHDGRAVTAARLENASFPLTIPALAGVWALATLAGAPPAAVALSRPFTPGERAFLDEWTPGWTFVGERRAVRDADLPARGAPARVSFAVDPAADGTVLALDASRRAVVPASGFRVGAVVEAADGRRVAAANVEHVADWTRGLCAERVALVAARAAGIGPVRRVYVACAPAPGGTPCGGCRQVLAELAPDAEIVIWRGEAPPEITSPLALLPGAFQGDALGNLPPEA